MFGIDDETLKKFVDLKGLEEYMFSSQESYWDSRKPDMKQFIDELLEFISELMEESDRAAVVLGTARLDVGIEQFLKDVMLHHPDGSDNLFDADRPLGTLSSKIALAYRLGLISNDVERSLQLVRKIRNQFAHSTERISLSEGPSRDRLRELTKLTSQDKLWQTIRENLAHTAESHALADFGTAIAVLTRLLILPDPTYIAVKEILIDRRSQDFAKKDYREL